MKLSKLLLISSSLLVFLSGCNFNKEETPWTPETRTDGDVTTPYYEDKKLEKKEGDIFIYSINDFHGDVIGNAGNGILNVASYLKQKKDNMDAIIINSGDYWQGAIESNYNHGELLTKIANIVEFDSMSVGNHEFDWGQQYIINNNKISDPNTGYSVPTLACNVYKYDITTGKVGDYANLGAKYVIRDLDNGIRVGIIGGIGKDQITSITSQFVDDISFEDPIPIVKSLSDELRTKKGCNVVLLSLHADEDDAKADDAAITKISPVSGYKYVDAVFCAHTHQEETSTVNGVPFIQSGSNGTNVGNINLHLNKNGSCTISTCRNISTVKPKEINSEIQALYDEYKAQSDVKGNKVLGNFDGTFYSSNQMANFVCTAIADKCYENDINVDFTMTNYARKTFYGGEMTYANLYTCLPFDNEIYIIKVSGQDFLRTANRNYFYRFTNSAVTSSSEVTLAVIDYVALHRNSERIYDNFPSAQIVSKLMVEGYSLYNYRDITEEYILEFNNTTINATDYDSSLDRYNKSLLSQNVSLADDPNISK